MKVDRIFMGIFVGVGAIVLPVSRALAQSLIVPDVTLGNENSALPLTLQSPNLNIITGGARRERNLFHSFREFNINTGNSAYFFIPSTTIQNVLARVTGSNASEILGRLGTFQIVNNEFTPSNANFFLINPNGVIFGSSASLDMGGSILVTTANAFQFPNGELFGATLPTLPSAVLTVDPSALLYNAINAQSKGIVVRSQSVDNSLVGQTIGLQVQNGKQLRLVGGDITIEGGQLLALGGRIEISSVKGAGQVIVDDSGNLKFTPGLLRGNVLLTRQAFADVRLENGGEIAITAGNINIDNSNLYAGILPGLESVGRQAGDIILDATDDIQMKNRSIIANNLSPQTVGIGGNMIINASTLLMSGGSVLTTTTFGQGKAGNLIINARDRVSFAGIDRTGAVTGAFTTVAETARGQGGTIEITTGSLEIVNGGTITSRTNGVGDAGNVIINARDRVSLNGTTPDGKVSSSVASTVDTGAIGNGGDIRIITKFLALTGSGALVSATVNGAGKAGNIDISASDSVHIIGYSPISGRSSGFFSSTFKFADATQVGQGGNISIATPVLQLANGAILDARTFTEKKGGNIDLDVNALEILGGAQLLATTEGSGSAGTITIKARNHIVITGRDQNFANRLTLLPAVVKSYSPNSGLYARSTEVGSAGDIIIITPRLEINDQGQINAESVSGNGGNIIQNVKDIFLRRGGNISTNAGTENVRGNGGNITIDSRFIIAIPKENSDITANAFQGTGGKINITSRGIFGLEFRPQLTDLSDITASSQLGISGTVNINSPDNSAIQNSLNQLTKDAIDTTKLLASTCIVRQEKPTGTFYITGTGGIPNRPNDPAISDYPTNTIQSTAEVADKPWKLGDPIVEPQGFYQLANGRFVMSRECNQ